MSAYGLNKRSLGGVYEVCKECRSQYFRFRSKQLYQSVSKTDDSIIRNVNIHNQTVITLALSLPSFKCIGFVPHTPTLYRFEFGTGPIGLPSVTIYDADGTVNSQFSYKPDQTSAAAEKLAAFCKTDSIRLEISDLYMMASKNAIYWY